MNSFTPSFVAHGHPVIVASSLPCSPSGLENTHSRPFSARPCTTPYIFGIWVFHRQNHSRRISHVSEHWLGDWILFSRMKVRKKRRNDMIHPWVLCWPLRWWLNIEYLTTLREKIASETEVHGILIPLSIEALMILTKSSQAVASIARVISRKPRLFISHYPLAPSVGRLQECGENARNLITYYIIIRVTKGPRVVRAAASTSNPSTF